MKKKINTLLLKNLIESDFLLLNKISENSLRYFKVRSLTNSSLDLFQLIKTLKQFTRILQFLNQRKKKYLQFIVEREEQLELLNLSFNTLQLKCPGNVKISLKNKDNRLIGISQALFIFDQNLTKDKNIFNRFLNNNIFLINRINTCIEKNTWGTYKIYNDLTDFKKIIFLSVLISKIFDKSSINS